MKRMLNELRTKASEPVPVASLAFFRILFGGVMLFSILRFACKGWIYELYIRPEFYFTYYGFGWVKPLPGAGMYLLFAVMGLAALGIMTGYRYRLSAVVFFVTFTWVELIDKTNYLNHYYFISIIAFLLIWVPAHAGYSWDMLRNPSLASATMPAWMLWIFRLQLGIVYFYAGIAKLNPDWLFEALPLKIWLPAHSHWPIIGSFFNQEWTAYMFSWCGAMYDLSIPFFLLYSRTRPFAYIAVIAFHVLTWMLFNIGMFPWIMILCTLVFFEPETHEKILRGLRIPNASGEPSGVRNVRAGRMLTGLLGIHFLIQLALPWRFLLYPGELFWTEEGFRFSWRVMLMEKSGYAVFRVRDTRTGREGEEDPGEHLTPVQVKMMSTQPDMIQQYAHFLKQKYARDGKEVEVYADVHVNLQGRGSRRFIHPERELGSIVESVAHKDWILPREAL